MRHRTTWELQQHTRIKHELLRKYLAAWFPILARGGHRRIIFLDGFAGPGIYSRGESGSPIISLDTLVSHKDFKQLSYTHFTFIFVENEVERFKSLEKELARFWRKLPGGVPRNIKVKIHNEDFASVAKRTVQHIQRIREPVPMFVFMDPFGSSGIPMSIVQELLSLRKCEVLINFMYDSVNRFISDERSNTVSHFAELFGTDANQYQFLKEFDVNERKKFLRDLYLDSLQRAGGCKFADSFEIWDRNRGRTLYFLIFGTQDIRGLEKMKEVMWHLDPMAGEISAQGKVGQMQLNFKPDLSNLKKIILHHFIGHQVTIEEIESFVLTDTSYLKSHTKFVLKQLEIKKKIKILSERHRKNTYPTGAIIRFTSGDDTLF